MNRGWNDGRPIKDRTANDVGFLPPSLAERLRHDDQRDADPVVHFAGGIVLHREGSESEPVSKVVEFWPHLARRRPVHARFLVGAVNRDFSASQAMVDFFSSHELGQQRATSYQPLADARRPRSETFHSGSAFFLVKPTPGHETGRMPTRQI